MQKTATILVLGFFLLLFSFRALNLYEAHFFDSGWRVVAYQAMRMLYIPYLLWLQYALGRMVALCVRCQVSGFIAPFFIGTAVWHVVLFALGLFGLLYYPVMLLLAGGVMVASYPILRQIGSCANAVAFRRMMVNTFTAHRMWSLAVLFAALLFLFLKGTYPSGGHDFFNHYFQYYREVVGSGNLGPHATWYQYFYSKGLGLYFMSMILLDPFAVHLVGTTFVIVAACIVFDMLRRENLSLALPLFGVFIYLMFYIYTSGRGIFAANGGWGDLEKTHELTAVLLLGGIWLLQKIMYNPGKHHALALYAVCVTTVIIGFVSGILLGLFLGVVFVYCVVRKHAAAVPVFIAGVVTVACLLTMLFINYVQTGIPLDQLSHYLWPIIDWKKVLLKGYSLELYSHLYDIRHYAQSALPFWQVLPKMIVEYYRLYMLWPLLAVGCALFLASGARGKVSDKVVVIILFLLSTLLFAMCFGGRSQFISFFRFSSFNYAPTLILCLMLWGAASEQWLRWAVRGALTTAASLVVWGTVMTPPDDNKGVTFPLWVHFKVGEWGKLFKATYAYNTGENSLYDAVRNQHVRVGRIRWGGIHPSMRIIYEGLPAKTRVWSFYNHSYCLLPACNVQQYFSQVTSPRWYDIALRSIDEGKKIMQEEGLNFFFYSRNLNTVVGSDTKDMLAILYKGLAPEHIEDTFGILWTNGWDYLLTWKEESVAPLDADFMESWQTYHRLYIAERVQRFPVDKLAVMVKQSANDPSAKHPPMPEWMQ